jgi:hypothetical protein
LVRIWELFGDIHTAGSVLPWWQTRGTNLFDSPQVEMEFVTRLIGQLVLVTDKNLARAMPDMLCLAIDLPPFAIPLISWKSGLRLI